MTLATLPAGQRRAGPRRALQMLLQPWAAIKQLFHRPSPTPLQLARKARWQAAEDYADTKRRGDTRDQHRALIAFRRATAEVVRLELGR
jgi:hypothetical protein